MTPGSSASCSSHRRVVALTIASLAAVTGSYGRASHDVSCWPTPVLQSAMALRTTQSPTMWWITSRCSTRTHAPLAFPAGNHRPPSARPNPLSKNSHAGRHTCLPFLFSAVPIRSGSTTSRTKRGAQIRDRRAGAAALAARRDNLENQLARTPTPREWSEAVGFREAQTHPELLQGRCFKKRWASLNTQRRR